LEGPKLGLYLPDTLSEEDINKLLTASILILTQEKNQCILEVLYGCGLRVSELVDLKISNINFKENFIIVEGKGEKTRLVPLARTTADFIKDYIQTVRNKTKINKKHEDVLFLNSRGTICPE
jgi:integrase/recombinase XerD